MTEGLAMIHETEKTELDLILEKIVEQFNDIDQKIACINNTLKEALNGLPV